MKKSQNLLKSAAENIDAFNNVDQNVVAKILAYLDFDCLSKMSTVSRFFRRKVLEQNGYWIGYLHRYLPLHGFSTESINQFFSMVGGRRVDYQKMLKRISLLKRIDFVMANLVSSTSYVCSLRLNSIDYGHRYLAVVSGEMTLICQISHQCVQIHLGKSKFGALYNVAYLLGMTNMTEEFVRWVKIMAISDDQIYIPFIQGLTYKKHDTELAKFLAENEAAIKPFYPKLMRHYSGMVMRSASLTDEVSALIARQLSCIEVGINDMIPTASTELALRACYSYSPNVDLFTRSYSTMFQKALSQDVYFILGMLFSENLQLFTYLIKNKILSPNQVYTSTLLHVEPNNEGVYASSAGSRTRMTYSLAFAFQEANFSGGSISLFQLACHFGCIEVVRLLVDSGCDLAKGNDNLHTSPLKLALLSKQLAVANFLCEQGILPNAENLLCAYNFNPLHYLLRLNIIKVEKNYPALFIYTNQLLKTKVTPEMAERFGLDDATVGTPLCLLPCDHDEDCTPVDYAYIAHQVYTLRWLLQNHYITNIRPLSLFRNIDGMDFSTHFNCERCSLQDLELYLPSPDDQAGAEFMLDAIWSEMTDIMIILDKNVYPEAYYFMHNSFQFLLQHYRNRVNADDVFNRFINKLFEFEDKLGIILERYEDFLRPLIEFSSGCMHLQSNRLIRNKIDLLQLVCLYSENPNDLNCLQYYLERFHSKSNFFEDNFPLVSAVDIQDLILQTASDDLSQVNPNDSLGRNPLCIAIDCYINESSAENFTILQFMVNKMPSLKTSDKESRSALTRIFENEEAYPRLYELFYRSYGSNPNQRYYSEFVLNKGSSLPDTKRVRLI